MTPDVAISNAVRLIGAVSGYQSVAAYLERRHPIFVLGMADRGQASLLGSICIGPETLEGTGDALLVSLAGTLVHEHWHTRQNPLLKTASFWGGVWTRQHPMRRYEQAAYARQIDFLKALAVSHPTLASHAGREIAAVQCSFEACYGQPS